MASTAATVVAVMVVALFGHEREREREDIWREEACMRVDSKKLKKEIGLDTARA